LAFRENPSVFTRVLQLPKITMMASLPRYDRLVLLANGTLISYSLQALVTVAQSRAPPSELDKTLIKLAPKHNGQVHFFRLNYLLLWGDIDLYREVAYDSRSFGSSTIHTMEVRLDGLKALNKVHAPSFSVLCWLTARTERSIFAWTGN